jgi:RNA polymerase sigma-70 factor
MDSKTSELAYEEFLEHYSRDRERFFAYIYALLPHQADAEDVFQRSSLLLWKKFPEYDRERPFLPWACSIAHYEVKNFLRSVRRDRLQFDESLVDQLADMRLKQTADSDFRLESLRLCLKSLKSVERDLIELAYRGESTIKEFAEQHGCSPQTFYNRVSLARRKLLQCINRRMTQEGLAS